MRGRADRPEGTVDHAALKAMSEAARGALGHASAFAAVVLGSGWGDVANAFPAKQRVPYAALPGIGRPTAAGHAGELVLCDCEGLGLLLFRGRRHWYEGSGWEPVAAPVAVAAGCGADYLVLTNAAGGIRADLRPGDLMAIDDHINAMGSNPLAGPHDPAWGVRFPDMSRVYDADLRAAMDRAARDVGDRLAHGVYLAACGPAYETPAEVAAFRAMGADAVGMSTVPEALLAHAAGLRVAGLSCITNLAAGAAADPLRHDEVLAETRRAAPRMARLLGRFLTDLANRRKR